ncbi:MAG: hypothetical protein KL863_07330 [Rhizobium sp.]|nr:hypothetical protein [Rhizobium sp.]MBX9455837.1 hypothetical protein [Rhizobium sp.]
MNIALTDRTPLSLARLKGRVSRDGVYPNISRIWKEREDLACRLFWEEPWLLRRLLYWRTPGAILWRCKHLGLIKYWDHRWTAREIAILRRLYPKGTREEICEAIPGVEWRKICVAARYYGFRRDKKPYKITGIVANDQVRLRCYDIKWTMRDLDEECRTGRYFQTRGYRTKYPNFKHINRAAEWLGGQLEVRWDDFG